MARQVLACWRSLQFLCLAGSFAVCGADLIPCRNISRGSQVVWRNCSVVIGGLAIRGPADYRASFDKTFSTYLNQRYAASHGLEFISVPLDFNQNFGFIEEDKLDFIYSNPAAYTCLMVEFGVTTVASMINLRQGRALENFAGVMFSRSDSNFSTVESLKHARVEAVSISGLGAMQLQQAELLNLGLDVMTDVKRLIFAYNQNFILADIRNGYADVGFVRTDLIDGLVATGAASWSEFTVINQIQDTTFPFKRSTAFTPEWPVGALPFVPFEIQELVGDALMDLDSSSPDPMYSDPAKAGKFATWVPPMNYFDLLQMLESISYYNAETRKCLRSEDVYTAIACPAGYVKRAPTDIYCPDDCKATYTCVCQPCAKLRDPAVVLRVTTLPTDWPGGVDTVSLEAQTKLEPQCERMGLCVKVARGQRLRWTVLDQIGRDSRMKINAPLLSEVQIRLRFDAPAFNMSVAEVNLTDGTETQAYTYESQEGDVGSSIVQIIINGEQAEMSPVVVEMFAQPLRTIVCGSGQEALEDGSCADCPAGRYGALEGVPPNTRAVCWSCQPGYHQPLPNQSSCIPCLPGYVSAELGALECTACAAGRSTIGMEGTSSCFQCEPGQRAPLEGSARCTLCPRGSFASGQGSLNCEACDSDKTTADVGATNSSFCGCWPGTYLLSSGSCHACPDGASCAGYTAPPAVKRGYYMKPFAPTDVPDMDLYLCTKDDFCPGGLPGTCGERRDPYKIACGACMTNTFEVGSICIECGEDHSMAAAPVVILVLIGVGLLMGFTWFLSNNPATKNTRRLNLTAMVTLIMASLQTMFVFKELSVRWFYPLDKVLQVGAVVSGDLESFKELKIGCGLPNEPSNRYVVRQIVPIVCVAIVFVASGLKRCWRGDNFIITFSNVAGTLFNVFFISMILGAVMPLVCYDHPGHSGASVRSNPSVLCFVTPEHEHMIITGAISFLIIPLPYAVCCIIMVRYLPMMVARMNDRESLIVIGTRFFFERYRAERYYFGLIVLARNMVMCLIPVVFTTLDSQVILVCVVLLSYMIIQQALQPWRSRLTNLFDGLSTGLLLIMLVSGAMDANTFGTIFLCIFGVITLVALLIAIAHVVVVKPRYHFFICHDPREASAQAKLLKMRLQEKCGWTSFVDMTSTDTVEELCDVVKCQVSTLIMYLTQGTLTHPPCAAVLAMADMTKFVKVKAVCSRNYIPPTMEEIENIHSYVDIRGSLIGRNGITPSDVQAAFRKLCHFDATQLTVVPRHLSPTEGLNYISCEFAGQEYASWEAQELAPIPVAPGMYLISVCLESAEAIAASMVFLHIARKIRPGILDSVCNLAQHASEDFEVLGNSCAQARGIFIFLSAGSMRSLQQLAVISEAMHGANVLADEPPPIFQIRLPDFAAPGDGYYTTVLPVLMPHFGEISKYLRSFMKLRVHFFTAYLSEAKLEAEVLDALSRVDKTATLSGQTSLFALSTGFREAIEARLRDFVDENNNFYRSSSVVSDVGHKKTASLHDHFTI